MTLEHDENEGMFSVVMPSVKPAMRACVTSWQVENVFPRGGRRRPGTFAMVSRSSNSFMPIGKVRRRSSWLSCSASSAMALPSSGGASVMVGASFIGFLLAPSRMLAQRAASLLFREVTLRALEHPEQRDHCNEA